MIRRLVFAATLALLAAPAFAAQVQIDPAHNAVSSGLFNADTTTPLTGSATFTGTARDVGVAVGTLHPYAYFNAFFFADQTGTAKIECSSDNSTWTVCATSAVAASTPLILTVPVMFRYHRAKLVNGSTNQGSLLITDSYTGG